MLLWLRRVLHNCITVTPYTYPSSVSESLQRGPFPRIPNPSPEVKCFFSSIIQSTALSLQTVQHETLQFHPCGKAKFHLSRVFLSIIPQCLPHLWQLLITAMNTGVHVCAVGGAGEGARSAHKRPSDSSDWVLVFVLFSGRVSGVEGLDCFCVLL